MINILGDKQIDFLKYRKIGFGISMLLLTATLLSILLHGGLKYGIDFAGGTLMQVHFNEPADVGKIREVVNGLNVGGGDIQKFGEPEDVIIHLMAEGEDSTDSVNRVEEALTQTFGEGSYEVQRVEMVGPKVGKDLQTKAMLSLLYAMVGILLYVSYRFEFRFALAAVAALLHDTLITVGAFSITGKEFTLPVVAALLTVIGYSLNDTIVVFDRIRENLRLKRNLEIKELINVSVSQTLGRTIITSGTTLIVILGILIFGGSVINDFAFALLIGVLIGTYSSIFVASPVLLLWPGTTTQTLSLAVKRS